MLNLLALSLRRPQVLNQLSETFLTDKVMYDIVQQVNTQLSKKTYLKKNLQ